MKKYLVFGILAQEICLPTVYFPTTCFIRAFFSSCQQYEEGHTHLFVPHLFHNKQSILENTLNVF